MRQLCRGHNNVRPAEIRASARTNGGLDAGRRTWSCALRQHVARRLCAARLHALAAGLAFRHAPLRFDLSYHDTNLTKEDCFVQTGDLAATPGGSVNPSSNPGGLRSGLCGRALVGTLSFEFEASKSD